MKQEHSISESECDIKMWVHKKGNRHSFRNFVLFYCEFFNTKRWLKSKSQVVINNQNLLFTNWCTIELL